MADTDSSAPRLLTSLAILAAMSLFFLTLRLWCKQRYGKRISWDDYIMACSWVCLFYRRWQLEVPNCGL